MPPVGVTPPPGGPGGGLNQGAVDARVRAVGDPAYAPITPGLSAFDGMQPIATHVVTPTGGSVFSDGSLTQVTYSAPHAAIDAARSLSLVYSNWAHDGTTEVANTNPITVTASVMTAAGDVIPVTWNGAFAVTIAPGADSPASDPMYLELEAGAAFWTRTGVSVASLGMKWPLGSDTASTTGNTNNGQILSADATQATNPSWTSPGQSAYGPSLILGRLVNPKRPVVAFVGASNGFGYNDAIASLGFLERACTAQKVPFVKVCKPGESGAQFIASLNARRRRSRLIAGVTHAVIVYGLNDLGAGGSTFAGVAGVVQTIARALTALGVGRVYFVTLSPRATSTDSFATQQNQIITTTTNYNSTRAAVNAWARAGFPVDGSGNPVTAGTAGSTPSPYLVGAIEIADVTESARDSGTWWPAFASDGAHANTAGHVAMTGSVPTFRLGAADTVPTVTPRTFTPTPPGTVGTLVPTAGTGQIALAWTAPGNNGSAAPTDYTVQYKLTSNSTWTTLTRAASTATSATITGLANGAYDVRVAAVNAVGTGTYTAVSVTVGGAGYDPTQISGLQAWYDPDAITGTANGAQVASWPDKSSNTFTATNATTAERPTLITAGIGGKACVRFAGAQRLLSNLPASTTPFTVIGTIVPTGSGNRAVLGAQASGGRLIRFSGSAGSPTLMTLVNQSVAQIAQQAGGSPEAQQVFTMTWDGTTITERVNGTPVPVGTATASAFTAGVLSTIGARDTVGGDPFFGDIGDLIQVSRVMSTSEIQLEERRQGAKYGITVA